MAEKYQNKYRIASARHQKWDYRWDAAYFITICTKNMAHYFGEIKDGKMQLSGAGVIADLLWHEIKNHAKNLELGEFIVMPNHIHGILILDGNTDRKNIDEENSIQENDDIGMHDGVQSRPALTLPSTNIPESNKSIGQKRFQNQGKNSISSIIGGYKSAVTKHANRMGFAFKWQPLFYDIIIHNDKSYQNIKNYIINNPKKWDADKFYGKKV
jgi:REP element-mobilizing transposase RayT